MKNHLLQFISIIDCNGTISLRRGAYLICLIGPVGNKIRCKHMQWSQNMIQNKMNKKISLHFFVFYSSFVHKRELQKILYVFVAACKLQIKTIKIKLF
jgi:hypothetical protein